MSGVPKDVEAYLNSLDVPDGGIDLTTCDWAILAASLARRNGRLPIPFGPRHVPWANAKHKKPKRDIIVSHSSHSFRRIEESNHNQGTGPAPTSLQTAFVLTDTTQTQAPFTVPIPGNGKSQTPIESGGDGTDNTNNGNPPGSELAGTLGGVLLAANPAGGSSGTTGESGNPAQPEAQNGNPPNGEGQGQPGTSSGGSTGGSSGSSNGGSSGGSNGGSNGGSGGGSQVISVGGSAVTVAPGGNGAVVVGSQTIAAGQVGTVNGQQVSVASGGTVVVGSGTGSQTIAVANGNGNPNGGSPSITIGGSVVAAGPSGVFVVASGVTLSPGGTPVVVAGTTYSIASGGSIAVINGATQTLAGSTPKPTGAALLTIDGKTVTATSVAGVTPVFVLNPGTTLTPGGSVVVSGTTYSLPTTGSAVIVNGKTSSLGAVTSPANVTPAPTLTINGFTFKPTVLSGKTYYSIAQGTTLTPGGVVTVDGTRISMAADGSSLVFGSSTSAVQLASNNATTTQSSTQSTRSVGDAIASGIGVTKKADARILEATTPFAIESFLLGVVGSIVYWL
jgi:hypothetical protein